MSKEISQDDFIEKYGEVEVTFSDYYKYTFTYTGVDASGQTITAEIGGNSGDIYKLSVSAKDPIQIKSLYPYSGAVYDTKTSEELESFCNY